MTVAAVVVVLVVVVIASTAVLWIMVKSPKKREGRGAFARPGPRETNP